MSPKTKTKKNLIIFLERVTCKMVTPAFPGQESNIMGLGRRYLYSFKASHKPALTDAAFFLVYCAAAALESAH